eukprot:symbB.v1.2.008156.t1/scaffold510.1/size193565/6
MMIIVCEYGSTGSVIRTRPGSAALRETCWLCTWSLIGLSAAGVSPVAGSAEPVEGSLELHHAALHIPATNAPRCALSWGTNLARDPLEAEDVLPSASSNSPGAQPIAVRTNSKANSTSLSRAASWIEVGRRFVGEFPPPSHDVLGISGFRVTNSKEVTVTTETDGKTAVRIGFLTVPTEVLCPRSADKDVESDEDSDAESVPKSPHPTEGPSLWRLSVQLARPCISIEPSWCFAMKEMIHPFLHPTVPPPGRPPAAGPVDAEPAAPSITQAVLCCSGFSISLQPFELHVGPVRGEWREQRVALDEAYLTSLLCETTVFLSSALPHLPGAASLDPTTALAQLQLSSVCLTQGADKDSANVPEAATVTLASLQGFSAVSTLDGPETEESVTHLEVRLEDLSVRLDETSLGRLVQTCTLAAGTPGGSEAKVESAEAFHVEAGMGRMGIPAMCI